jgi:hypothetical protein
MDIATNRIIDSHISEWAKKLVEGSTREIPGSPEMEGVGIIASRWRTDHRVRSFLHDNDVKTQTQIQKAGFTIEEGLDVSHAVRAVTRRVEDFHKQNAKIFRGIENKLILWLTFLLRSRRPPAERNRFYVNAWMHFCDIHNSCVHGHGGPKEKPKWAFKADPPKRQLVKSFYNPRLIVPSK